MLEFFARMRSLCALGKDGNPPSQDALRSHLGTYLGAALGLLRFCRALRDGIAARHPERHEAQSMRSFLTDVRPIRLHGTRLAARGLWMEANNADFSLQHDNFTSFSLAVEGATIYSNLPCGAKRTSGGAHHINHREARSCGLVN